jgi:hypothetical protein
MCDRGRYTTLSVPIPADLSYTGEARRADKPIDSCIAPIVAALNAAGILTASCCCGHGDQPGSIVLQDGRELRVFVAVVPLGGAGAAKEGGGSCK